MLFHVSLRGCEYGGLGKKERKEGILHLVSRYILYWCGSNYFCFFFNHHSFSLILLRCAKANTLKVGNGEPVPRDRAKSCEVLLVMLLLGLDPCPKTTKPAC